MKNGRLTYHRNKSGRPVIDGRVMPTMSNDNLTKLGTRDLEDAAAQAWQFPPFEALVREVEQEVEAMRHNGLLRPFKEGERIGVLPRRVRSRKLTAKEHEREHNERMQRRQHAMLAQRAKNDEIIASLLGRL